MMNKQQKKYTSALGGRPLRLFFTVPCKYPPSQRQIEAIYLEKSDPERKNSET
jgi:hypothetical protein